MPNASLRRAGGALKPILVLPRVSKRLTMGRSAVGETVVLQLCSHPVVGWPDAPPGIIGLWSIQVAAI